MYCGLFNAAVAFIVKWSLFLSESTFVRIFFACAWMEVSVHYVAHVCKSVVFLSEFESHIHVIVDRTLCVTSSKLGCALIRIPVPKVSLYDGIVGKSEGEEDCQGWLQ